MKNARAVAPASVLLTSSCVRVGTDNAQTLTEDDAKALANDSSAVQAAARDVMTAAALEQMTDILRQRHHIQGSQDEIVLGLTLSTHISYSPIGRRWLVWDRSWVFSALVGVSFGYYPARKAAFMDPIQALHYE